MKLVSIRIRRLFGADLGQLSSIQPIPPAIGTLIDLYLPFRAEKVSVQAHLCTARAVSFALGIHCDSRVAFDLEQWFARGLLLLIDAL